MEIHSGPGSALPGCTQYSAIIKVSETDLQQCVAVTLTINQTVTFIICSLNEGKIHDDN